MQKHLNVPESSSVDFSPSATRLQFFVRILSNHTLVVHAEPGDTIRSVHEKIQSISGIPVAEQRLIYRGKQLQWEQTLSECGVQNDAGLHLVGRMRSTGHPQAWQLVDDVISQVCYLCKNNPPSPTFSGETVKCMLLQFLNMTSRTDFDQASNYLEIFKASSAPAALVMLYRSSYKPNRDTAEYVIKHFITSCKAILPEQHYRLSVPIVLEFCRLLSMTMGIDDSLYVVCRSSLGKMMDAIDIGEKKYSIAIREVIQFVDELAKNLSYDLVSTAELCSFSVAPLSRDVQDFLAFAGPARKEILKDIGPSKPIQVPLRVEFCPLPLCHKDEIVILHGIFFNLLNRLEKCMVKLEKFVGRSKECEGDTFHHGWHYLDLLKELNSISKLYHGCEDVFWETMRQRNRALCFLIQKYSRRSDDHSWIFECKEVTNFKARRHLAMMLLPEVKAEFAQQLEMLIDRSNLLAESFEYIIDAKLESLHAGLFIEFKNEEATGPGVLREWFFCVCQAIFNPENPLFIACPHDRRRFFPNPASTVDPINRKYFVFVGKVIALALMHKIQLGIVFDRVFLLQLAERPVALDDIQNADPTLHRSCKQILDMDPNTVDQDVLGLTFVDEVEELGTRRAVELCPGGKSLSVDSQNRGEYVRLLVQRRFVEEMAELVNHFAKGFAEVVRCRRRQRDFFRCLEVGDLDRILYGSECDVLVDDWRAHTECCGFAETDVRISWFWKIVESMTKEQKRVLLFFWTSIKHLPCEGFSGLASRLYIYKTSESTNRLPSSHTCLYRLCLPAYPTMPIMQERLQIITKEHVSCSFGSW